MNALLDALVAASPDAFYVAIGALLVAVGFADRVVMGRIAR